MCDEHRIRHLPAVSFTQYSRVFDYGISILVGFRVLTGLSLAVLFHMYYVALRQMFFQHSMFKDSSMSTECSPFRLRAKKGPAPPPREFRRHILS